jgi:hypothetical protein
VREHVAANLAQRRLEQHQLAVVLAAAGGAPKSGDGTVQDVEPFIEVGERRLEVKPVTHSG